MFRHPVTLLTLILGLSLTGSALAQTGASCGPVQNFQCQANCDDGSVILQWNPFGDYEGYQVLRNGLPIGFVPGPETLFIDLPPAPGVYDYVLEPFCLFGPPPPPSICTVDFCPPLPPTDFPFIRGDANSDGSVNLGDWVAVLTFLFGGGTAPCLDAYDTNDDGAVNVGDAIFGLTYQFGGGLPIPEPFFLCGFDPTPDPLGCLNPTSCPPLPLPPAPLPLDLATQAVQNLDAFAVKRYDETTGLPLPIVWIEDPALVNLFRDSIDLSSFQPGLVTHDATASTLLRTTSGQVYGIDLAEIEAGQDGIVIVEGGYGTCGSGVQEAIGSGYGDPGYSSLEEKEKESTCDPSSGSCDWEEEELIPETSGVWVWTDITLIIYQDNEGDDAAENYANAIGGGADTEVFEANGKNSIINKMRMLQAQCKRVRKLIFVGHGSAGSFRIGPENTPFDSATRVGLHDNQTSPTEFGEAIAPYLAPDAEINLVSCSTAQDGGTDATDGQQAIQDLADASGATVTAADDIVTVGGGQASTQGALHTATPGGDSPTVTTPAPAGNFDPRD